MALDWYILARDADPRPLSGWRPSPMWQLPREPGAHVAMDEETHQALMARGRHLPLLRRAADFYRDAVYTPADVGGLLAELAAVGPSEGAAAELAGLCRAALAGGCGVVAVSD